MSIVDVPYPYKDITEDGAIRDYMKLREKNVSKLDYSLIGVKACDYFMQIHHVKTRYKNKKSKIEAWKDSEVIKKITEMAIRYKSNKYRKILTIDDMRSHDYRGALAFIYGSMNNFKPAVAKYIYKYFNSKKVLDFSAGWGNRLLGALACDIDYIGIDSNKNLIPEYKKMYELYKSNSKVQFINAYAEDVDYSNLDYDTIFTSPPYYDLEKYEYMKSYESKGDFINTFFKPVIMNSWKYLKPGGYLVLNIPVDMKNELLQFGITKNFNEIKMPLASRFAKTDKTKRFEYIYWIKKE